MFWMPVYNIDTDFLKTLQNAHHAMRSAPTGTEVLPALWDYLPHLFPGRRVGLYQYDAFEQEILSLAPSDIDLETIAGVGSHPILIEWISANNQPLLALPNATAFAIRENHQMHGILIISGGQLDDFCLWGVEHLITLILECHEQIELSANNARLASSLGRSMHNLSVVLSISDIVSKAQDIKHLLSMILKVALTTVNAGRGFIMLENEKTHQMEIMEVQGVAQKENKLSDGSQIPLKGSLHQRVMESRKPVILSDFMMEDENLYGIEGQSNSLMCVPLVMKESAFGVIYVTNKEGAELFEKEDLDVLSILATYVASVLDQAKLYNLATTDELTGLYTRRYYVQRIGEEFRRTIRYQRHLSLIVIDIDHFKNINDEYGHLAGDEVLRQLSQRIVRHTRQGVDIAVRYGGEEFVIILPETHLHGAKVAAERLRRDIERQLITFDGHTLKLTISLGVSSFPENGSEIQELFNHADHALYASKNEGRNRVTTFPHTDE